MAHVAAAPKGYTITMGWKAAAKRALRWFAIAAGGQMLALATLRGGVFGLGEDDFKLIANAGIIAVVGWAVDFLSPKTPAEFGVTKVTDPPQDGTP